MPGVGEKFRSLRAGVEEIVGGALTLEYAPAIRN